MEQIILFVVLSLFMLCSGAFGKYFRHAFIAAIVTHFLAGLWLFYSNVITTPDMFIKCFWVFVCAIVCTLFLTMVTALMNQAGKTSRELEAEEELELA